MYEIFIFGCNATFYIPKNTIIMVYKRRKFTNDSGIKPNGPAGIIKKCAEMMFDPTEILLEPVGMMNQAAGIANHRVSMIIQCVGMTKRQVGIINQCVGMTN